MVRSAVADESLLRYLTSLVKRDTCTVGLILGQPTESKDYVIHFAKTPPSQGEILAKKDIIPAKQVKTLSDIADGWVAEHAKCTTRMLPGGMYVLGIFIISKEDNLTPLNPKAKSILQQITKQLASNSYLYGNAVVHTEKLILNYCTTSESFTCKSYDTSTSSVKTADFKFVPKATKWHQLECKCELDQTFPIPQTKIDWPLRKHMTEILHLTNENLKSARFLFDGEVKDAMENLESIGKKKNRSKSRQDAGDSKLMHVTIFLPCDCTEMSRKIELIDCGGHIRITGQVICKLWLHPKATIGFASQAVKQDLIRSLAARLEMHWDSLTEEEHGSPEDTNSVHEPPRRVLVSLPDSTIALSDYLFPGEGPQEAQISLQEMLDIKVNENDDIKDEEGQADLAEYYNEGLEAESDETLTKLPKVTHKFVYMVGIGAALVVLIISIVIHFFTT